MKNGFIKISRRFFHSAYWREVRSFSQAEAWVDLIQLARFEAKPAYKILPSKREITIKRGELHASLRFLSARWGWSTNRTKIFIDKLMKKGKIARRIEQGETVISLCKYDRYNEISITNKTPAVQRRYTGGTTAVQIIRKKKNSEEGKEGGRNAQRSESFTKQNISPVAENQTFPPLPDFSIPEMRCSPEAEALLTETIAAWNEIPHAVKFQALQMPEIIRMEFFKRLQEFGEDGIRKAVAGMRDAEFFKTKANTKISFKRFLKEHIFMGCKDGEYRNVHTDKTQNKENLNDEEHHEQYLKENPGYRKVIENIRRNSQGLPPIE